MNLPSNSTKPGRLVQWLGFGLIALLFYAMLTAMVLLASFVLLQRGITPDLPWVAAVQKHLYMKAMRSIWQTKSDCVEFDAELIYKPKLGACQFNNAEFSTTLNFAVDGRLTGPKPEGIGIAVLGDSHAMGWGVADDAAFAAELQRLSRRPVYNLAVSSYGTLREVHRLEKSGLWNKIDTIIIQYCDNDLAENQSGKISGPEESRQTFETIMHGKQNTGGLFNVVRKAYGYAFSTPFRSLKLRKAKPHQDFTPHYAPLINILAQYPKLKEKRVLIFYSNAHGKRFGSFPVGIDKRLPKVEFLDLAVDAGDYYRLDDHLTPAGHQKVARELFVTLQKIK
jgi:lysophospholipase L1-like esterase